MKILTSKGEADASTVERVTGIVDVAASDADGKRRTAVAELIRIYDGDACHLVRQMPSEDAAHFKGRSKLTPPLLSHSLRQISFVYDLAPHRLVGDDADSTDSKEWEKRFWSYGGGGFNSACHSALPIAKLTGQLHAWYRYSKSPFEPVEILRTLEGKTATADDPGIATDLWTSDQVVVLSNPVDRRFARATALLATTVNGGALCLEGSGLNPDQKAGWSASTVEIWHYLDDTYYGQLWHRTGTRDWMIGTVPGNTADGVPVHLVEHGLDMSPVQSLPWKYDPAQRGYWVKPWAGQDLIPNISEVYSQLSQYLWTAVLQRGQPVARGILNAPLGPDVTVLLGDSDRSSFTIIPNNANLAGMKESVTTALSLLAKTLGLPSRTFRLEDTAALSGIAIVLDRGELEDQRRADEQTWRRTEGLAHSIAARVMDRRGMGRLSTDVATSYTPLAPMLTQEQKLLQAESERREKSMGLKEYKSFLHADLPEHQIDILLAAAAEEQVVTDVTKTALNGAQTTALQGLLESIALGTLDPDAAAIAITNAFPSIEQSDVKEMTDQAASTQPQPEAQVASDN